VLRLTGRRNEAMPLVRRALRAFSRKGAEVRAVRARQLLEELDPANDPEPPPPSAAPEPPAANAPDAHVASDPVDMVAPSVEYAHVASDPTGSVAGMPDAPDRPPQIATPSAAPAGIEPEPFEDSLGQELSALNPDEPPDPAPQDPAGPEGSATADDEKGKGRKGIRFW